MAKKGSNSPPKKDKPEGGETERFFDKIDYWVKSYGSSGGEDQHAVNDFMTCETRELIEPFRTQLYAISKGKYDQKVLDTVVGAKRRGKHGSYDEWARIMLLWMVAYKG